MYHFELFLYGKKYSKDWLKSSTWIVSNLRLGASKGQFFHRSFAMKKKQKYKILSPLLGALLRLCGRFIWSQS